MNTPKAPKLTRQHFAWIAYVLGEARVQGIDVEGQMVKHFTRELRATRGAQQIIVDMRLTSA